MTVQTAEFLDAVDQLFRINKPAWLGRFLGWRYRRKMARWLDHLQTDYALSAEDAVQVTQWFARTKTPTSLLPYVLPEVLKYIRSGQK